MDAMMLLFTAAQNSMCNWSFSLVPFGEEGLPSNHFSSFAWSVFISFVASSQGGIHSFLKLMQTSELALESSCNFLSQTIWGSAAISEDVISQHLHLISVYSQMYAWEKTWVLSRLCAYPRVHVTSITPGPLCTPPSSEEPFKFLAPVCN